jgi:hypothetical protein
VFFDLTVTTAAAVIYQRSTINSPQKHRTKNALFLKPPSKKPAKAQKSPGNRRGFLQKRKF